MKINMDKEIGKLIKKKTKYTGPHRREYTVVGGIAAFKKVFQQDFIDFFGYAYPENYVVVKNGIFYFFQPEGEREKMSVSFLKKVNKNKINLNKSYSYLKRKVSKFEELIKTPKSKFTLVTYKKLINYYHDIFPVYLASTDAINFLYALNDKKIKYFKKWSTKTRLISEQVFKKGELNFMPRYLDWLASSHLCGYSADLLRYVFYEEIMDYIDSGEVLPSIKELKSRKKLLVIAQYPVDKLEFFTKERAAKIIKAKGFFKKSQSQRKNIKSINGNVAFPGQAQGYVKLILSRKDMSKFRFGNILVSQMTVPDYLPIMKKSAAIVTDEGGVLCHAAIVAREIKKPCIIGTKVATQVLKDGDLVEADAEKGVVRIIK